MLFSSMIFLSVFLPVVLVGYYFLSKEKRLYWLLLASLFFYSWGEPKNVAIMLLVCLVNYIGAIIISKVNSRRKRLAVLICDVSLTLFALVYFKYFNFLLSNINIVFQQSFEVRNIVMPLGISFFIFQTLSYVIDVYRKEVEPQISFYKLTLYISFFPQLIAGPIVQYHDIVHDIEHNNCEFSDVVYGVRRFIIGLGKKVLIANQLGEIADNIFNSGFTYVDMPVAWIGALCYSLQLFYDFSGYSDMAIGMGQMLGFKFPENFNYPYMSKSITEFWKRWHITLGQWFKEYVYIPLGGNRKGLEVQIVNLFIVWSLTGLWHGAGWNFLIWGLYYFVILLMEKLFLHKLLDKLPGIFSHIYSIFIIVVGWVIFACDNFDKLGIYIKALFGVGVSVVKGTDIYLCYTNAILFIILIFASTNIPVKLISFVKKKLMLKLKGFMSAFCKNIGFWCCAIYYFIILALSIALIIGETYNPFLYFRF